MLITTSCHWEDTVQCVMNPLDGSTILNLFVGVYAFTLRGKTYMLAYQINRIRKNILYIE